MKIQRQIEQTNLITKKSPIIFKKTIKNVAEETKVTPKQKSGMNFLA